MIKNIYGRSSKYVLYIFQKYDIVFVNMIDKFLFLYDNLQYIFDIFILTGWMGGFPQRKRSYKVVFRKNKYYAFNLSLKAYFDKSIFPVFSYKKNK